MSLEAQNIEQFPGNSWVLPTDIDLVGPASESFVSRLVEAGIDKESDLVYNLEVAFREAIINAIAHGNLGVVMPDDSPKPLMTMAKEEQTANPSDKKVYVDIVIDSEIISVTIRDEGKGFNSRDVADPREGEAVLKPRGRGIMFMNSFFDSVTYNEPGNEVKMVKKR